MAPASGFYTNEGHGRNEVRLAYILKREELAKAMVVLRKALEAYPGRTLLTYTLPQPPSRSGTMLFYLGRKSVSDRSLARRAKLLSSHVLCIISGCQTNKPECR